MSVKPGIRLGDRYQLLSPIATGGMGQVWRAEDTTLHRVVAAKILRSEFTGDETFLARFRAEARNTASLSHPNIASVYDYGEQVHESERLCYLVMELVEGKPLVDILARERRLSPARTLDYLEQTASGLAAAHRAGMVHRDVKPGNLIIRPDGVLKITDFGIARAANSVALTERGTVVGTAQYLAPEQAEGKPARPTSDIYALGVVGYECLAGFRPFDGDNSVAIALSQIRDAPPPLPADVPPHVRALIELTMCKNPDARYADGASYVPVVRAVQAGNLPPRPMPPAPQPGGFGPLPGSQPVANPPGVGVPATGSPAVGGPAIGGPPVGAPGPGAVPHPAHPGPARSPAPPGPQPGSTVPPPVSAQGAPGSPSAQGGPGVAQPGGYPRAASASGVYPSLASGTGTYQAAPPVGRAPGPPPSGEPAKPGARIPWVWILLTVLLVAAVIVLIVVLVGSDSESGLGAPLTMLITELKEYQR